MAKIKLKISENEIEVDSRDFYVDNQTLEEVITNLAKLLEENKTTATYENTPNPIPTYENTPNPIPTYENTPNPIPTYENTPNPIQKGLNFESLNSLEDVELFEPEFNEPKPISAKEIKDKLKILEKNTFFNIPRTVTETVQQLREYGWVASPLDVSKTLVTMASNKEISKNSSENRTHYYVPETILV